MSSQQHHSDTLGHQPQEHSYNSATSPSSPTRAYFPPSKTTTAASLPQALSAASLVASLASKKAAYINHPSIQKVIASHTTKQQEANSAPGYYDDDDTIANIPDLDLLPPPPVYDIVNCSTSQTLLLVSSLINTILAVNDRLACPKITLFHSRAIPNISIEAYLSRILQYAPFQNEVLLIILLYFDRIGGGCKPTQVLTNTIPKSLLRQASLSSEDISQLTAPKAESVGGEYFRSAAEEKSKQGGGMTTSDADNDILDEEEPIADEIYTSSSESPVGSKLIINSFNIHRLLITSILVACKFSSDVFYPNVRYARVGGLPLSELNQLELEFLFLSQFELNTTESELQTYGNKLLMYHQR
ncbi:MAG: cyclin-domain-containing protein, partial [Linnemannia gamsii]